MNHIRHIKPSGARDGALDIEFVRDAEGFRALHGAWGDLYARAARPHVFQRFEWLWQAWECIARPKGRELLIVVGRIDGRIVLIWPLVRHGKGFVKFLASDRGEYRDVLVEAGAHSEKWIGEAWDALQAGEQINVLHLQDLQAHSLLKKVIEARAPRMRTNLRPAPYIDLKAWPDYEAYFSGLSRNLRQDQTRQLRRLSELGEVRYVVAGDR
jgi:CelD/BcsL family acetyltransferase involved in cellulose biosynthesis